MLSLGNTIDVIFVELNRSTLCYQQCKSVLLQEEQRIPYEVEGTVPVLTSSRNFPRGLLNNERPIGDCTLLHHLLTN